MRHDFGCSLWPLLPVCQSGPKCAQISALSRVLRLGETAVLVRRVGATHHLSFGYERWVAPTLRASSAPRSRSKNWGFSASDPTALSFRRLFQRNCNSELILRIFDDSSKTGRIRRIPEEFQKNSPLPTGDSEPRAHPHCPPGSAKKWCDRSQRRHRRLTCGDRARSNAPCVERSR